MRIIHNILLSMVLAMILTAGFIIFAAAMYYVMSSPPVKENFFELILKNPQ